MNSSPPPNPAQNMIATFSQLNQQDVEEFYLSYQYWYLQHEIELLQNRLDQIHGMMLENTERMQHVQPTAIELATLARLQSNGVSDVDLLDRMLERGEAWLDRTMQRLDYLEQLDDFIREDYTEWCKHALEGAYDWIDSVLDSNAVSQTATAATNDTNDTSRTAPEDTKEDNLIEATEELFLQKISAEDELEAIEITSKRPSINVTDAEEVVPPGGDITFANHQEGTQEESVAAEEPQPIESSQTSTEAQALAQEPTDTVVGTQTSSKAPIKVTQVPISTKRPGFMKRFLGKIWGS